MTRATTLGVFLLATLLGGLASGQVGDVYHVHDPAIAEQDGRYYDGEHQGVRRLQIRPLTWSEDGWPLAGPPIAGPVAPAITNSSR